MLIRITYNHNRHTTPDVTSAHKDMSFIMIADMLPGCVSTFQSWNSFAVTFCLHQAVLLKLNTRLPNCPGPERIPGQVNTLDMAD